MQTLIELLPDDGGLALVFVRTKAGADRLVEKLRRHDIDAVAIHGDKAQVQREKALARFDSGKVRTLVATDVAARGLDVDDITHVINFDPPEESSRLHAPRRPHRPRRARRHRDHARAARAAGRRQPRRPPPGAHRELPGVRDDDGPPAARLHLAPRAGLEVVDERLTAKQAEALARRARRARGPAPHRGRRRDQDGARVRRPVRELRVPRRQERAGPARGADPHAARTGSTTPRSSRRRSGDEVGIGSVVEVTDEGGEAMTVEISAVGGAGTVSPTSPLGSALLGHKPGETVDVAAPRGSWKATIQCDPLGLRSPRGGDRRRHRARTARRRSRLIGSDPSLVLHGGGNTSTKLVERDHLGRERRVLRIKGSGSDLATIEARRLPGPLARRPAAAARARRDERRGDGRLPRALPRRARRARGPSIETLLHAFLPAAHVDHVHADAICALANAPDPERGRARGARRRRRGRRRTCGRASSSRSASPSSPDARAVVLAHHGLVTWGETHEESYGLTLELVAPRAEYPRRRARARAAPEPDDRGSRAFLVRLRGRLSRERRAGARRSTAAQRALADRADVEPARRDAEHARPHAADRRPLGRRPLDGDVERVPSRRFRAEHGADPRLVLVPGLGVVAAAPDARAARHAARDRGAHARLGRGDARPVRRRELARRARGATTSSTGRSSSTS